MYISHQAWGGVQCKVPGISAQGKQQDSDTCRPNSCKSGQCSIGWPRYTASRHKQCRMQATANATAHPLRAKANGSEAARQELIGIPTEVRHPRYINIQHRFDPGHTQESGRSIHRGRPSAANESILSREKCWPLRTDNRFR